MHRVRVNFTTCMCAVLWAWFLKCKVLQTIAAIKCKIQCNGLAKRNFDEIQNEQLILLDWNEERFSSIYVTKHVVCEKNGSIQNCHAKMFDVESVFHTFFSVNVAQSMPVNESTNNSKLFKKKYCFCLWNKCYIIFHVQAHIIKVLWHRILIGFLLLAKQKRKLFLIWRSLLHYLAHWWPNYECKTWRKKNNNNNKVY